MSDSLTKIIPNNWVAVTLGEVALWGSGGTPSRGVSHYFKGNIPWIKTGELGPKFIRNADEYISEEAIRKSSAKVFPAGSVGIAMYGATIGKVSIWGIDASTNQACAVAQPYKEILNNEYLYYFLLSEKRGLIDTGKGGAQPNISQGILKEWPLYLPPLPEQHRIIAKIEALFSELDKGIESFKTAREQLKTYRQALLKHAFSGKLTEQWRAENAGKLESAKSLLQRIQDERQQRYQQQLKDWEQSKSSPAPLLQRGGQAISQPVGPTANTIPPFEKGGLGGISKPKAPKTLPPLTAEELAELPELPEGWAWVKLGHLTWSVKDGPHFSPKYSESGIPFISGGNVRPEGVDFENTKFISQELHEELCKRCKPEINDILYTKGGTTGIARVNTYNNEFSVWVHVAVLKLVDSVRPFFLQHSLNSNFCYTQAQKYTHGVGNQDLGLTRMVNIVLAICPFDEQDEVVKIIDDKISIIEQLDQTLTTALQQAEALRQSILKKAFSGQLVPQDPSDEPASVLLERIRAKNAQADKQPARHRGRTK